VAQPEGDRLIVHLHGADARGTAVAINKAAAKAGIVLAELHARRLTLESQYLSILEGNDR
jgi:predicted peptidase